jgi:uncharacterized protein YggU (UPF0235/DUF167 family)
MARIKADFPDPAEIRALIDTEGRLAVRVTPGAKVESLEVSASVLQAKVRAKPEDGKANEAVRQMLARALNLASSRIEMLRGATSREKLFRVS